MGLASMGHAPRVVWPRPLRAHPDRLLGYGWCWAATDDRDAFRAGPACDESALTERASAEHGWWRRWCGYGQADLDRAHDEHDDGDELSPVPLGHRDHG